MGDRRRRGSCCLTVKWREKREAQAGERKTEKKEGVEVQTGINKSLKRETGGVYVDVHTRAHAHTHTAVSSCQQDKRPAAVMMLS